MRPVLERKRRFAFHGLAAGLLVVLAMTLSGSAVPSASAILARVDRAEGFESMYSEMNQYITTTSGSRRKLVMRMWAVNNGEKQLAEYTYPPDIKGQKILMTDFGDNIWMYNAETRRTRKLGSHMKRRRVMGTDFTYEDQAGGRYTIKYNPEYLRSESLEGTDCYVLELKPTPRGPSYQKLVAWVGKSDYLTRRVDFYDEGESSPHKRLVMSDIRQVGSKKVAHRMVMENLVDNTRTVNELTRVDLGVSIPSSVFESRNLER
jgi:outer membrane lipoprotein-sorting protein